MIRPARVAAVVRALAAAFAFALALGGCASGAYYVQAVGGHLAVAARAQPVERVLEDSATPDTLAERLRLAQRIRAFATEALALPDNGSYRAYARLGRAAVVWNVFAAPEFSVQPRRWCYPVAGCVIYRGYFDRAAAQREADRLREREALQTWIGAVPAYSTLGWMDDPLLDTFIHWPEPELAGLIFHELAHQIVYVRGDTAFNESFAVTVEIEGVRRWLRERGEPEAAIEWERARERRERQRALLLAHRERLERLYASGEEAEILRERRRGLEQALADAWRAEEGASAAPLAIPNNARLAAIAAYATHVRAFQRLLAQEGGDLAAFHRAVRAMAALPAPERARRLAEALRPPP